MSLTWPSGRFLVLFWLPILLLVLGWGLTWHNVRIAAVSVQSQTEQLLAVRQRGLATLLEDQLRLLLASSRNLISNRLDTSEQFRRQAVTFLNRHPTLHSVELIRRVPAELRPMVEEQLAEEHPQGGRLQQWGQAADTAIPALPDYLIVRFSHSQDGRGEPGVVPGLLANSVPHWRQALTAAAQQQRVTATSVRAVTRNGDATQLVRLFVPVPNNQLLSLSFQPERWLGALYGGYYDSDIQLTVHDLSHHSKTPLYQHLVNGELLSAQALRTEVAVGDRYWMVASVPTENLFAEASAAARRQLWLSGLAYALLASLLLCWPLARGRRLRRDLESSQDEHQQLEQRFANLEVEKTILHQALEESGQRARDLVGLAGGFIAELDEQLRIGFISDQVSELLDQPPAEMANRSFGDLVTPAYRDNFQATLKAAREERRVERIDLELLLNDQPAIPVSLRLKALIDPVHGCVGYRLSAVLRH
ncbi:MAG: PAS domain-containing protein [Marinobacter sp.]|nr:PAS domain-containing protein [Marinobacter sp.]